MNRRSLLIGLTALAMAQVACQQDNNQTLRIAVLKDVLPPQVLADFKRTLADTARLRLKTANSSAALFTQLQAWHQAALNGESNPPSRVPDWVCVSDYWLWAAIRQQLISPISAVNELSGWSDLPEVWRSLSQRNSEGFLDDQGPLWATPYRWGHLMMVYSRRRFDRLGWQPTQWEDLWRPELQRQISLPNHPRIVLGVVLKTLGYSANDRDPASHTDVEESLAALGNQVKVYTSDDYLQSLIMEDIWLAVGWSTEIQPVLKRYRQLAAVSPSPGTLLTADVWVRPNSQVRVASTSLTKVDQKWLSYWWQPNVLTPLTLFSQGLSPLLVDPSAAAQASDFSEESVFIPTPEQLANSEFIVPLPEEAIADYNQLWLQLRRGE